MMKTERMVGSAQPSTSIRICGTAVPSTAEKNSFEIGIHKRVGLGRKPLVCLLSLDQHAKGPSKKFFQALVTDYATYQTFRDRCG
jgi:hypothetical protein